MDAAAKAELKQKIQDLAKKAEGMHWREIRRLEPELFDEIKRRYGSLKGAFEKLGIEVHMKGGGRQKGPYKWTKETVIRSLKEFVGDRESVEVMEVYRSGPYLYKKAIQYFGSVEAALREDPSLQNVKIIRREKGRKPIPLSKETKQMLENLWRGSMDEALASEQVLPESELLRHYVEMYGSPEEAAGFLKISAEDLRKKFQSSSKPTGAG